jgi:hypothetical protein
MQRHLIIVNVEGVDLAARGPRLWGAYQDPPLPMWQLA